MSIFANMKQLRDLLGYILGLLLFVVLMPTLMWMASGMPALWTGCENRYIIALLLMLIGLALSIWTIVKSGWFCHMVMALAGCNRLDTLLWHHVCPSRQRGASPAS